VPLVSAIIPLERGRHSLVAALDGFLAQPSRAPSLEIIVVASRRVRIPDRLRRLTVRFVTWPRGRRLAAALNAGVVAARAPIVMLLDPKWRPLPGLTRYGLDFHDRYRGADVLALTPSIDPALANDPLLWWLTEQGLSGVATPAPGIHSWRAIRFDALSAPADLVRAQPIPEAHGDHWLMRYAWAARAPLRVFSDRVPVLATAAPPALDDVMAAEYEAAYARLKAMRAGPQAFAGEAVDDRFKHPGKYLLTRPDQRQLAETIADMTGALAGRSPRFAVGSEAEAFATLAKLYLVAVSHARSTGWSDAKHGRTRRAARAWPL
jgi:hypothetical protein